MTVSSSVISGTGSEAKGVRAHEVVPLVLERTERENSISEGDERTRPKKYDSRLVERRFRKLMIEKGSQCVFEDEENRDQRFKLTRTEDETSDGVSVSISA